MEMLEREKRLGSQCSQLGSMGFKGSGTEESGVAESLLGKVDVSCSSKPGGPESLVTPWGVCRVVLAQGRAQASLALLLGYLDLGHILLSEPQFLYL